MTGATIRRWIVAGALVVPFLLVFCVVFLAGKIEADLTKRAEEKLSANHPWARVEIDGRDARLTGTAPDEAGRQSAIEAVDGTALSRDRGTWGVRVVSVKDVKTLEVQDPYSFDIVIQNGQASITGFAPRSSAKLELEKLISEAPIVVGAAQIDLAAGAPDAWLERTDYILKLAALAQEGRITLKSDRVSLDVVAKDRSALDGLRLAFSKPLPLGLQAEKPEIQPPLADPYQFFVLRYDNQMILRGHAPNQETVNTILKRAREIAGEDPILVELMEASGVPQQFLAKAFFAMGQFQHLQEGTVELRGNRFQVVGSAATHRKGVLVKSMLAGRLPFGLVSGKITITSPAVVEAPAPSSRPADDPLLIARDDAELPEAEPGVVIEEAQEGQSDQEAGGATASGEPTSGSGEAEQAVIASPEETDASSNDETAAADPTENDATNADTATGTAQAEEPLETTGVDGDLTQNEGTPDQTEPAQSVETAGPQSTEDAAEPAPPVETVDATNETEELTEASQRAPETVLQIADPFTFVLTKRGDRISVEGFVPSREFAKNLEQRILETTTGSFSSAVSLASGAPDPFEDAATFMVDLLDLADTADLRLDGTVLSVSATALDVGAYDELLVMREAIPQGVQSARFDIIPPAISPYVFAARLTDQGLDAKGAVPSEDLGDWLEGTIARRFGTNNASISTDLRSGAPASYEQALNASLLALSRLSKGDLEISDNMLSLSGTVSNNAAIEDIQKRLLAGLPGNFVARVNIERLAQEPPLTGEACGVGVLEALSEKHVYFRTARATLLPDSFGLLDTIAATLARCSNTRFAVVGHTDSVGGNAANQQLSMARALSVTRYLVRLGIEKSRLDPIGKGETEPVAPNDSEENRALNRRIEVTVIDSEARG
ncbi:MAG: OmpA family protein [Pseudomonadota bacterium]